MGEVSRLGRDVVSQLVPVAGSVFWLPRGSGGGAAQVKLSLVHCWGVASYDDLLLGEGPGQYRTKVPDSNGTPYS